MWVVGANQQHIDRRLAHEFGGNRPRAGRVFSGPGNAGHQQVRLQRLGMLQNLMQRGTDDQRHFISRRKVGLAKPRIKSAAPPLDGDTCCRLVGLAMMTGHGSQCARIDHIQHMQFGLMLLCQSRSLLQCGTRPGGKVNRDEDGIKGSVHDIDWLLVERYDPLGWKSRQIPKRARLAAKTTIWRERHLTDWACRQSTACEPKPFRSGRGPRSTEGRLP